MAKEPDYRKLSSPGLGAGRAAHLKGEGARVPANVDSSRLIERGADIMEMQKAARGKVLGQDEFKRALDTISEFRAAQQNAAKLVGKDPAMTEQVKFMRAGAAGTTPADTLKKVGLSRFSTHEDVASHMGALFQKVKKGEFGQVLKDSSSAIKAAAEAGNKGAISILKSQAFKNLAKEGLVGLAVGILSDTGKEDPKSVEEAVMAKEPGA